MTNYLLTVIGDIESEKMCEEIALSISPLIDSPNLKFQYKTGVLLMSFGSETQKSEVYNYINGILYGVMDIFILTEISDKVSVSMPKEISGHLFDLENVDYDVDIRLDMDKIMINKMKEMEEDFDGDDISFEILSANDIENLVKRPTLDELLDKINNEGYSSLTAFERDILENYSK
jgi:hypothetical protein